jgi:hypothetical protein
MKTNELERIRAEQLSAAVDRLIRDPEAEPGTVDPQDAGLVCTAQRLAHLPSLLGPVDPALERKVMHRVQGAPSRRERPGFRLVWAAAGVAAALLLVLLITPAGQTAVASFFGVFQLGRTEVQVTQVGTPTATAQAAVRREVLTLEDAQARLPFTIPQPAYLPEGYGLQEVSGYSYPDLPAWLPQPFFVELVYGGESGAVCTLRVYPITVGEEASISALNLEASSFEVVKDVEVEGKPAVLLRLGDGGRRGAWQEVVWEHGDLILALSASDLTETQLLQMAGSVE